MLLNLAIAIVIGSLLGVGVALLREKADPRLRSEEDVGASLNSLLLGVLPNRKDSTARISPSRSRLLSSGRRLALPSA
jgi:capsular polysaccharide biosynthesis protein